MNKPMIDQLVDRFLGWKLPEDFSPDCGITFKPILNSAPVGTNLLTAAQAKAMLEHVLAPLNANPPEGCVLQAVDTGDGWYLEVANPATEECVALLAWPESWPETITAKQVAEFGFEIC